jgi:hypothetical protein
LLASSGTETFGTSGSPDEDPADVEPVAEGDAVPSFVVVQAASEPAEMTTRAAKVPSLLRNKFGSPMP